MAEQTLSLPTWSRGQAQAMTALCHWLTDHEARWFERVRRPLQAYGCELARRTEPPLVETQETARASTWLAFSFGASGRIWVELSTVIASDLAAVAAGVAAGDQGPIAPEQGLTPLQSGLLIFVVAQLVDALSPLPAPLVFDGRHAPRLQEAPRAGLCYACHSQARSGMVRVWVPLAQIPDRPPASRSIPSAELPIRWRVCLASRRFELTVLAGLRSGDMLLFSWEPRPGTLRLVSSGTRPRVALGTLDNGHCRIEEVTMAHSEDATTHADQLSVVVEVCAGTVDLPLDQALALGPGQILALPQRLDQPVALRISGRTVGHGTLIDVDGVLGVRITDWPQPPTGEAR